MSGFQWIRDVDVQRQFDRNLIPYVPPEPIEAPKNKGVGLQWVRDNDGESSYLPNLTTNKSFIHTSGGYMKHSPEGWKIVSPTLPTLTQFQEEGMEDLSVFDRKVQPVLESPQQMTSEVLGEGKVFKGTVDLKKYFDLRKLEVK